ncbi:DUF3168 domain-containing protein [Paracoccus aminophilus]|uniref:DUF3168 domain-containing protein n=1 Tax=Paracoccus aminophilus JCM 7686 TaxID=1367847 RepID=S5YCE8_PARAH|nr:DUF3168 domain-containing protein [Paracoccus aminophilus]AGT09098.1 hypothetical protein JCM7686_2007 [Paracoccus aminophilus JCM 7686]
MRAGRKLRVMVIARIEAAVPALAGRVYDRPTEKAAAPYAALGPSDWRPDDAECIAGRVISLQIDVWEKTESKGALEDLTDDVAACLKGWADTDALTMHPIEIALVRVMDDPDPDWVHGVVQIEVEAEE